MAKSNKSRYAVLGMLSLGPASGYDIKKMMQESTAYFWRETDSSIYPILKELMQKGLVAVSIASRGARERKVYQITAAGIVELDEWLKKPALDEFVRSELLLKLFFSRRLPKQVTIKRLQEYKKQLLERKKTYAAIEAQITKEQSQDGDSPFWLMTLRYGQLHLEAGLSWCDEALKGGLP